MQAIDLNEKLALFTDHWSPKIVAELNGQHVKLAKLQGTFDWHKHVEEDELFLVLAGRLTLRFRDREVELGPGQMCVVPRGVEHQPHSEEEVSVLVFEPVTTLNTGDVRTARTVERLDWI